MPLSVPSSNGGPGLSGLLRQTKPLKADDGTSTAPASQPATASTRPGGRSSIDSTQRGTAQITAALTVYLSKLGGSDDAAPARPMASTVAAASTARTGSSTSRSGAADLLRTLDAYKAPSRLSLTA